MTFTSNQYARKKKLFTVTFNKWPNPAKHAFNAYLHKKKHDCLRNKGRELDAAMAK